MLYSFSGTKVSSFFSADIFSLKLFSFERSIFVRLVNLNFVGETEIGG